MTDRGYLDLRRTKRGPVLLTLFAPQDTPEGVRAPSMCAHAPLRRGTRLLFGTYKIEIPEPLDVGMHRTPEGFFLRRAP